MEKIYIFEKNFLTSFAALGRRNRLRNKVSTQVLRIGSKTIPMFKVIREILKLELLPVSNIFLARKISCLLQLLLETSSMTFQREEY